MKIRVADYIAHFLLEEGITDVFSIVGGGAMYLNDAFGHVENLHVTYNHHEQACAIAAESYARINGKIAAVCVTTGPGGTNAITGVLCGYQDSIPMLILSGQVRYSTTVESIGLNLRQMGEQEFPIIPAVDTITKYSIMIRKPEEIKYHLKKALYLANEGRKGPCWIDIPLDVQGAIVDTNNLIDFVTPKINKNYWWLDETHKMLEISNKPVILIGSVVRYSDEYEKFLNFSRKLRIPVLATASTCDIFPINNEDYFGTIGTFGGRAGNFIIQNADLIIALGSRLSFKQIGFNTDAFSPNSKKIVVDIDSEELKKKYIKIDLPINADISTFIDSMNGYNYNKDITDWQNYCNDLKSAFPTYLEKYAKSKNVNPYYFAYELNKKLSDDSVVILGNSVACVCVSQLGIQKKGQRLYTNKNCGTMGYDLPAAIGASIAKKGEVFCITGDGSFQMNIQELQTIVYNKLPIKIIIFNNGGYQAIMQTQTNFFHRLSGCNSECGLSMPDFERIAYAYNIPYVKIKNNDNVKAGIDQLLSIEGYALCELIQDVEQGIEPRSKSIDKGNGQIVSPPIDNLYPFLPEDEYKSWNYECYIHNKKELRTYAKII